MFRNPKIKSLGDIPRNNAEKYPNDLGLVSGETRLTWGDLNQRVNRLANGLLACGINKGEAVACMSNNRHELIETLLAANKIGAPFSPVNYRLAPEEVKFIIENVEAKVLVFDPAFTQTVEAVVPHLKGLKQVFCMKGGDGAFQDLEEFTASQSHDEPNVLVSDDDLAVIPYTSGTTGFPKGVMGTHGNMLMSIPDTPWPYTRVFRANVLVPVPVFGAGAMSSIYNSLYGAGKLVFMNYDTLKILETIDKERIELMGTVPIMVMRMLDLPDVDQYDLSSIKALFFGASPMSVPMLKKMRTMFDCDYYEAYGMCETMGILGTMLEPHDLVTEGDPEKLARVPSAGRAQKNVEIKVVRDDGTHVEIGGEVGEIAIKSYGNMKGYWKNPEATAKVLKDGWYFTGDLGYIDDEGYVFLVDRRSDMIKTGGSNVYPAEVEKVLENHPAVVELSVIGLPDPDWTELVTAVVRLKPGEKATKEDLIEFCKDKIAGFKKPKKVIFVEEELPRNALGKVPRKDLKKKYT